MTWSQRWEKKKHLFIALFLLFIYLSPLIFLGENAHITIYDNLDSNVAWYKVLSNSGQMLGSLDANIPQMMNGQLSRNAIGSEWTLIVWLYKLLPTMTAYTISQIIVRVFGFIGMYALLKKHFIREKALDFICVYVALAFAITPIWPSGMLSILGMPLALWAFLNIRQKSSTWKDWLTLILLPFYSSFILGFFFFLTFMGLLWLRDLVVKRDWNFRFLGGIVLMTAIYLMVEYRCVASLILTSVPSSRNEFTFGHLSLWQAIQKGLINYSVGHPAAMTLHTLVILPLSICVLWILVKTKKSGFEKDFVYLFILNLILSLWYGLWDYRGWAFLKEKSDLLRTFHFSRFHFLRPMIVYILFAIGCAIFWRMGRRWKLIVKISLVLQLVVLFGANSEVFDRVKGEPTFKQFYATNQFEAIAKTINKPKSSYRVISIGMYPSVSQYNGFYTLDGYVNFYPLSYKHQFRKVIEPELNKGRSLKSYFDHWGQKCYVFVDELGKNYQFTKDSQKVIHNLQLNTTALKEMGGEYLLSALPIENAADSQLTLIKVFDDKESAWRIYLYAVAN